MKNIKTKVKRLQIEYKNLTPVNISECIFADDLAMTVRELQHNISIWNEEVKKVGLNINAQKTKIMKIGGEIQNIDMQLHHAKIEQASECKYLGATIENKGTIDFEINQRVQSVTKTYHPLNKIILSNKNINRRTKMTLYKTVYRPILIHGCETWVMNNRQKSKLQAMEMKYLLKKSKGNN